MPDIKNPVLIKSSKLISILLNPVAVSAAAFTVLIILNAELTIWYKSITLLIALFFTTVVPTVVLNRLKKQGKIESYDVVQREKRIHPLIISTVSYFIAFILLLLLKSPPIILGLMLSYVINTLTVTLITFKWKVSLHAVGICGPLVALHLYFGQLIIPFYSLVLLVGAARLILKRHTLSQVIVGSLIGLIMTAVVLKYLFAI
jgi:membrane-associated phospholipid phosphatase